MGDEIGRYSGKLTGGRPPLDGVKNGRIPLSSLTLCETQKHLEKPFLYGPAARAFDLMAAAAAKDKVKIHAVALYRDFDGQVAMKKFWTAKGKPKNAATPGTSNHGWGTAADINRHLKGVLPWLVTNAPGFGWDHPMWAGAASGPEDGSEPWHWQYILGSKPAGEIPVFVKGVRIEEADAFKEEGRVKVALRPVVEALNGQITGFSGKKAFVDGGVNEGWIEMETRSGRGFVLARSLADTLKIAIEFQDEELRLG